MAWDRLKRFLGRQEENAPQTPDEHQERFAQNPPDFSDVSWIEAADNAWGVRVETAKKPGQTLGQHGTAGTNAGTPPQVRC